MKIAGIAISALLCVILLGCRTSSVIPIGKDTYTVSVMRCGLCEPVQSAATEIADHYCATRGKQLQVKTIDGHNAQPWAPGTATVVFNCLSENDPEYKRAVPRE